MVAAIAVGLSGGTASGQDLDWARRAGGTLNVRRAGVAADAVGNTYVTGVFTGSATFGSGEPNATTLVSAGFAPPFSFPEDIFVAKYGADGTLLWARRAGGTSFDAGAGIAIDQAGNSYVTGTFRGPATFGLGGPNQTTLTAPIASFVAKYDAAGELLWARQDGGFGSSTNGRGIAVDEWGDSYVTGTFMGNPTFGAANPTPRRSSAAAASTSSSRGTTATAAWCGRGGRAE